ncbi:MAG: hypothetical protein KKD38_07535 [Candidatus Delongbacteria bacterium]|nr:hypothetical protein [Candidatus Delongbacteria bacterium]MCG2759813.1 hypothetical protein [Candidatus Delongbacteria bacterium]
MKKVTCFISFLFVVSTFNSIYAGINFTNNYDKIDSDLILNYDRYGRTTKSKSKDSDGFSYFWRSLLIPGWGEYKLGLKKEAGIFFITDLFLIGTAAGLNYYSGIRTDEYKDYAELYAGVNVSGKTDSYWIHIANYDNTLEYNEQKNISRYFQERYEDEEDQWNWVSSDRREKYNDIRVSAENADTWFYYSIGGIALNHFLSALNASGKAGAIKGAVTQSFDERGNVKNKLQLTYDL